MSFPPSMQRIIFESGKSWEEVTNFSSRNQWAGCSKAKLFVQRLGSSMVFFQSNNCEISNVHDRNYNGKGWKSFTLNLKYLSHPTTERPNVWSLNNFNGRHLVETANLETSCWFNFNLKYLRPVHSIGSIESLILYFHSFFINKAYLETSCWFPALTESLQQRDEFSSTGSQMALNFHFLYRLANGPKLPFSLHIQPCSALNAALRDAEPVKKVSSFHIHQVRNQVLKNRYKKNL
jgi:hypothetical protein